MSDLLQVLYVEDDPDIRAVAEFALEDEGVELEVCETGMVALEKAKAFRPDLLLLDVMMPGIDGPTTLQRLREYSHLVDTPAIFMTAKVQPNELEQYEAAGAIGVISKPFDPMGLADEIRRLLKAVG